MAELISTITPAYPGNHPANSPPLDACFLGRDKELANLVEQLHPGKIVAVCGPGGMGKSALAAQAVHELEESRFPDGIIFHSFYHQSSTDMALQTICEAFQIEAKAGLATAVRTALADKKALLILDGAEEAEDLKAVLDLRSTCGVLITSRKRSDARGTRFDLQPLEDKAAVDVFCAYSGVMADDASVQDICKILNGWPVALRIAGRYLSSTGESATTYLRFLSTMPFKRLGSGEHQDENAALLLRRSVEQVSADAVQVLRLVGVLAFASIGLEPVMAVLGQDGEDPDEAELRSYNALNQLVIYGLLEKEEERWKVSHALIHTYAHKELALSREVLERMAAYYIEWCETQSEAGKEGYIHLNRERPHCLLLIKTCLASELWQEVKDLVGAMQVYLDRQGWWKERLEALVSCLTAARQADDSRDDEGWCLNELGYSCNTRGEQDKALQWYEQCLPIWCELGKRKEEGVTLNNIANIYNQQGKHEQALEQYEQSLIILQEVGDRKGEGTTLNNMGMLYGAQGDHEQALQYYQQCLPITREVGDKHGEGTILNNIATIYRDQGNPTKTVEYYKQDLAICQELGDRAGKAESCWNIGITCKDMGELATAEKHINLAVQIAEDIGHPALKQFREGLKRVRAERRG